MKKKAQMMISKWRRRRETRKTSATMMIRLKTWYIKVHLTSKKRRSSRASGRNIASEIGEEVQAKPLWQ
jgi:hypothetical protein